LLGRRPTFSSHLDDLVTSSSVREPKTTANGIHYDGARDTE